MNGSQSSPSLPDEAIEYAGLVIAHCAAVADANREGELICPFAVITDTEGRRIVDFESETQEEAVAKGWASLPQAKAEKVWWAFGREGIHREPDGKGTDVLAVTVWIPGMKYHHSFTQRFGRRPDQSLYLIGSTEALKHEAEYAEALPSWNEEALARGIGSHPKGTQWSRWRSDA